MKRPFAMNYRTYDPAVEGYGNPRQWQGEFRATMNLDEAARVLNKRTPEAIMGVAAGASWSEIKTAWRAKSHACHPDRCAFHGMTVAAATEAFKVLSAAYAVLEDRHTRSR